MKEKFPGFANRLKLFINHKNIKQYIFARSLGIQPPMISELLNRNANPSKSLVKLISCLYSVNEIWLLSGQGSMEINMSPNKKNEEEEEILDELEIARLLEDTREVLRSKSIYKLALRQNIMAFSHAYRQEKKPPDSFKFASSEEETAMGT